MSGIGEKIINEIVSSALVRAVDNEANNYTPDVVLVWGQNAAEQLEALVEQHIREMSAEDVMRIRWPEEKIPE